MSDEKLVILGFKYFQNKKWYKQVKVLEQRRVIEDRGLSDSRTFQSQGS